MKVQRCLAIIIFTLAYIISPLYAKESGFKEIKKEKYGQDVLHTYEHAASGLEVIWIENKDVNKAFMVGVKTPTNNDTGVNHILEHTLFTGSKAYPSSSVFFDASEAYPSTYMNALTSGDMTIFPFATPYLPCYEKLLSIYLDAIFRPNLLEESYGFYEEGFHWVPEEARSGGVVYNEMKGAYSSLERAVYRSLRNMIYEETHYAYDSGGAPDAIPTLTYEAFVETYEKYYYPGNMKIIIYGDVPLDETLKVILSYVDEVKQPKESVDLSVAKLSETTLRTDEVLQGYNKACITKSFVIEEPLSAAQIQALDLWMTAYLMSPQTYFQSQLLKQGIHAKWLKDDDVPYPIYTVAVSDVPVGKIDIYNNILDRLIDEISNHFSKNVFLEQDVIKEAQWMWQKQDSSNNRGITIGQSILDGWAHNKELNQYYLKKEQIKKMEALDETISDVLLKKAKRYTLILLPSDSKLKAPEDLSTLDDTTWSKMYAEMKAWQSQKSSLEPVDLEELVAYPQDIPTIRKNNDYWEMETRAQTEWARSELYLNTSHISQEELPYLFLYSYLFEESAKDITPFSGIIDTQCTAYPLKEGYWPCFKVSVITPVEETEHSVLFCEARNYLLSRPISWYHQKLIEYTLNTKASVQNNSLAVLSQLCLGGTDERSTYLYQQGYPQYEFCQNLLQKKDGSWIEHVREIDTLLYHKGGTILATTLPEKGKNLYAKSWENLIEAFPRVPNLKAAYNLKAPSGDCWVESSGTVDYSFKAMGKEGNIEGTDYLVAAYLTKNYLNPRIRVKLGAYGAGCQIYDLQTMGIYTYRDPDYRLSSEVIDESATFLEQPIYKNDLECSKAEALSKVHRQFKLLGTALEKASMMEQLILWGKSPREVLGLQREILEATPETIMQKQLEYKKLLDTGKTVIMTKKAYSKEQNYTIYRY